MFKNIILPDNARYHFFHAKFVHPRDVFKTVYQQDHNYSIKKFLPILNLNTEVPSMGIIPWNP